jgi:hypothetical protein
MSPDTHLVILHLELICYNLDITFYLLCFVFEISLLKNMMYDRLVHVLYFRGAICGSMDHLNFNDAVIYF